MHDTSTTYQEQAEEITLLKQSIQELQESESRYKMLFSNAAEGILVAELQTKQFIHANPALCRMFGFSEEEILRLRVKDIHPEDSLADVLSEFESLARCEKTCASDIPCKRKDGSVFYADIRATSMVLGGVMCNVGYFTDITERKEAEKKLLLIQKAVEDSSDAIGISDPRGRHYYQNKAFTDLLGYTAEELGESVRQIVFADQDTARYVFETIMRGGSCIREVEYIRKDGRRLTVLLRADAIKDEAGKAIGLLSISTDITQQKQAKESLSKSERKFSSAFHLNPNAMAISDIDTSKFIDVNEAFTSQTGYSREEIIGNSAEDLQMWVNPDERKQIINALKEKGEIKGAEVLMRVKNDNIRNVLFSARFIEIEQDSYLLTFAMDITERKRLEEQLLQSQKLEAVGVLAGGVAHDFNNILGAIIGYAEITLDKMAAENPLRKNLGKILDAAQRSANITRQLLAFARKQVIAPVLLELNACVETTLKMIHRLIGENIELIWSPATSPCKVMMDPSQLDQILLNLCVNARDAIGGIGRVTIETDTVGFDKTYCLSHGDIIPGQYVQLSVSDNGCGMDKEAQKHIFEPFFTTKGLGQGTGMGLATVYGIVKQNKGFIHVDSDPEKGTTFKIYFPLCAVETPAVSMLNVKDLPRSHGETILIVEDDPMILEMSVMMLQNLGYAVLSAAMPGEAIRIAREHCSEIHLLITDVVLPEMNGRDLAQQIQAIHPMIKSLFMSGYTADVITHQGVLDEGVNFIQKPFLLKELAIKISQVLA